MAKGDALIIKLEDRNSGKNQTVWRMICIVITNCDGCIISKYDYNLYFHVAPPPILPGGAWDKGNEKPIA